MEVVIYAHPDNKKKEDLLKMIFHKVTSKSVMVFDFERLFELLRGKLSGQLIFVFLISNENEIEVLMASRSSFFNSRTIIILPDNQDDMTQKALSLQPSYIAYINYGFEDVCDVLNKIMGNHQLQPSQNHPTQLSETKSNNGHVRPIDTTKHERTRTADSELFHIKL